MDGFLCGIDEIALPKIYVYGVAHCAPKVDGLKADRVGRLMALTIAVILDVGDREHSVETDDDACFALHIDRGSGMAEWMPLTHAHPFADPIAMDLPRRAGSVESWSPLRPGY
jgi:hypothetical protein